MVEDITAAIDYSDTEFDILCIIDIVGLRALPDLYLFAISAASPLVPAVVVIMELRGQATYAVLHGGPHGRTVSGAAGGKGQASVVG